MSLTGWIISNRNLFPLFLRLISKTMVLEWWGLVQVLFQIAHINFPDPHMIGKSQRIL
jgi:hypothetical protein